MKSHLRLSHPTLSSIGQWLITLSLDNSFINEIDPTETFEVIFCRSMPFRAHTFDANTKAYKNHHTVQTVQRTRHFLRMADQQVNTNSNLTLIWGFEESQILLQFTSHSKKMGKQALQLHSWHLPPNLLYGASIHRRRHINKIMIIHFYSLFHFLHSPLSSASLRILPRYSWKSRASIPISTPTLSVDTSERSLPRLVYIHVMHRCIVILPV